MLGEIVSALPERFCLLLLIITYFCFQDRDKEEHLNSKLTQISVEEILDAQRREIEAKQEKSSRLKHRLKQRGVYNILEDNE